MSGSSTTWILIGAGAALLALLLLLGAGADPAPEESAIAPVEMPVLPTSPTTTVPYGVSGRLPVADAGADVTVGERETIQLAGSGYDPAGGAVSYLWTASGGLGFFENAHSPTTSYTAPSACDCDDSAVLTLTVTSTSGTVATDQMIVWVRDPATCPSETYETEGYFVVVPSDACATDSHVATCPATPSEPCESPCISEEPADDACPIPAIPCPCATDCEGDLGGPSLTFDPPPAHPKDRAKPTIVRQYPRKVNEGSIVRLEGVIHNPTCQVVCYFWSADKGWFEDADTLTPIFHVPDSDRRDGETVTIKLIVYDGPESYSYEQIRIRIINTDPT